MVAHIDDPPTNRSAALLNRPTIRSIVAIAALMCAIIAVGFWLAVQDGRTTGGEQTQGGHAAPDAAAAQTAAAASMQLVVAGIPQPLPTSIPLTGNLVTSVTLSGDDAAYARTVDLYLFREDSPAEGIDGAAVRATARMELMDHGTIETEAVATGGGHYLIPLRFTMPGDWQLDVVVSAGDQQAEMILTIGVWA